MKVRDKYLLIMAVVWGPCLALAAAAYGLVLRPQLDYRHDLETKIDKAKGHYTRAVEAAKPELHARLNEQVGRLQDQIEDFLVPVDDAAKLAYVIGGIAAEMGLESISIRPTFSTSLGTSDDSGRLVEKRFDVNFVAGFTPFVFFLNTLERHEPVVFIETFTINRPQETDAKPQVQVGLAVLVEKPRGT